MTQDSYNPRVHETIFQRRLEEVSAKTYIDFAGQRACYLQPGHLTKLEEIYKIEDPRERLTAACNLLTMVEERASLVAKARDIGYGKLPEAGSANEADELQALKGALDGKTAAIAAETAIQRFLAKMHGGVKKLFGEHEAEPSHG